MERVSAQYMLFPLSKQEFAIYGVIRFKVIQGESSWCQLIAMGDFLFDFY